MLDSRRRENHFTLPDFITPVQGMLMEVLNNETTTKDKIYLNGLGTTKGKSGDTYIMLKTGIEVS